MLPARIQGVPERQAAAEAAMLLDTIGLRGHLYKRPMNLSGGEQQRVSLARAMMNELAPIPRTSPPATSTKKPAKAS